MMASLEMDNDVVKVVAILALCALEISYMFCFHVDGAVFGGVVAVIAGLAGYEYGKKTCQRESDDV